MDIHKKYVKRNFEEVRKLTLLPLPPVHTGFKDKLLIWLIVLFGFETFLLDGEVMDFRFRHDLTHKNGRNSLSF